MTAKPHELHELATVGTMLVRPETIPDLADLVAETDFASPKLRAIYRAMVVLHDRGEPVDTVTLRAQLAASRELELVGDLLGIQAVIDAAPTGVDARHWLHHARQVRVFAAVRELGTAATNVAQQCRELQVDPRTILDDATDTLAARLTVDAEVETPKALMHRTFRGIVRRRGGHRGVDSGLVQLDDLLLGMDPGNVYVVAGRPGMGKTALATSILRWNAKRDIPGAIVTLEMTATQLTERMLCADAGVDNRRVRAGTCDAPEYARLVAAADRLTAIPLAVLEPSTPTIASVRSRLRAWRRTCPTAEHAIAAIDYLGLIDGDGDTAEERIAFISRAVKRLAKELKIPILLLAQLNRGVEARASRRPIMSDLRGSGAIEQDADAIVFIYRGVVAGDVESMAKDEADLILEKYRHGPTGVARVRYIGPRTLFCNAPQDQGP